MLAEVNFGAHASLIQNAIMWIASKQRGWGWYNTADTAAAIQAFMAVANVSSSTISGLVSISLNGIPLGSVNFSSSADKIATSFDLDDILTKGANNITISWSGTGIVVYYFRLLQTLRTEIILSIPDGITGGSGDTITIAVLLENPSEEINPIDLILESSFNELTEEARQSIYIPELEAKFLANMSYTLPLTPGSIQLPGVILKYSLVDRNDPTIRSQGVIRSQVGPILVSSTSQTAKSFLKLLSDPIKKVEAPMGPKQVSQGKDTVELSRNYSNTEISKHGDPTIVTITVKNLGSQVESFLMVEDPVPAGFDVDTGFKSLSGGITEFKASPDRISFFVNSLAPGITLDLSYGLISSTVYSSVAAPATLTSMYDTWRIQTLPQVLGRVILGRSVTGDILRDLLPPDLISFHYEQTGASEVSFSAIVSDDQRVASVELFYLDAGAWGSMDLGESVNNEWIAERIDFEDQDIFVFVVIQDSTGNIFSSELIPIALQNIIVPVFGIMFLVVTAIIGGVGARFVVKRRLNGEK